MMTSAVILSNADKSVLVRTAVSHSQKALPPFQLYQKVVWLV